MSSNSMITRSYKRGVGKVALEALVAGKTNEEALALVRVEFPQADTTLRGISSYRSRLRREGFTVPTDREIKRARKDRVVALRRAA